VDENKGVTVEHMVLKREADRIALLRQEHATRTLHDFEKLVSTYDGLDENRERRERYHEIGRPQSYLILDYTGGAIIPVPMGNRFWRQLLSGNFLDVIYDCPYDIQELITGRAVYELLRKLKDEQKEVLYYWDIMGWTPQKIAAFRGQTDRNILKVYAVMIESLRYKLYMRLLPRFKENLPLSASQQRFMENNWEKYGEGKPKRKRRKKCEMP
jgi:hypothetical protein